MGCSGCTRSKDGQSGCEAHKVPQRAALDAALAAVYPTRTWGAPDDEARFGAGFGSREVGRLARALSAATRAPTFHRPGAPEDLCELVYVLCVGREPALVDVRDGLAAVEEGAERVRERYLRVAFSTVARLACVQEVAMELDHDGELVLVRELPQPGVYDAKLLKRMRAVVDLLQASDVEHVDFGLLDVPWEGADTEAYRERYGVEPALVNWLFYAAPARVASTIVLPLGDIAVDSTVESVDGGELLAEERGERRVSDQRDQRLG